MSEAHWTPVKLGRWNGPIIADLLNEKGQPHTAILDFAID